MQPDYQKIMADRQQQEQSRYQQSRDPFEYGRQVAQRRYSEIMSGLDAQRAATQQSYGDMYQAARQRAVGAQASSGMTMSGGMGQQQRDFVSAMEMQELGKIGQAREQAGRDLYTQAQSAMSNAQLEGQQATQMELGNQQAQLQLVQQRQAIVNDPNLAEDQKIEQLQAMGVDTSKLDLKAQNTGLIGGWEKIFKGEASFSEAAGTVISTAVIVGGVVLAIKYGPALLKGGKALASKLGLGGKAAADAAKTTVPTMTKFFVRIPGAPALPTTPFAPFTQTGPLPFNLNI